MAESLATPFSSSACNSLYDGRYIANPGHCGFLGTHFLASIPSCVHAAHCIIGPETLTWGHSQAVLYDGRWFPVHFNAWSNTSIHALNTVFAGFEIFIPRTVPPPPLHLLLLIIILALYLGLAYLTKATQGFYTYSL